MSSRKNKVLIGFALMIITMNIFALTQVNGIWKNDTNNESVLPSYVEEPGLETANIIASEYNETNLPSMKLWDLSVNVTSLVLSHYLIMVTLQ
ncbi:MAG: hypothetical protein ACTSSH_02520 [Candidatus Heimdallarchaeota archaeon]